MTNPQLQPQPHNIPMQDTIQLMSDEELIKEYKTLDYSIYEAESYGVSDMLRINAISQEIDKRGDQLRDVLAEIMEDHHADD